MKHASATISLKHRRLYLSTYQSINYGLGRLNVTYQLIVRKLKFYKSLYFKSGFFT